MKMTLLTESKRRYASMLALTLAIALLSGLLRPQTAIAQGRRMPGGGGRMISGGPRRGGFVLRNGFGGVRRGGGFGGARQRNIVRNNRIERTRTRAWAGNMGGRASGLSGGLARSVNVWGDGMARQTIKSGFGTNGALPARAITGYRYNFNARLYPLTGAGWETYFPYRSVYYPHYYLNYTAGVTAPSLYYYYGTFPPYIAQTSVISLPPRVAYIPVPLYTAEGLYQGDRGNDVNAYALNQNQLNQNQLNQNQLNRSQANAATTRQAEGQSGNTNSADAAEQAPLLTRAIEDLNAVWNKQDIRFLTPHIRQDARVAVYLRGKYFYSLDGGDYLDMTRDALYATRTVNFALDRVQHSARDIYTVSGRHTYTDMEGKSHTVLVSYVLEKTGDEYYLTQIGTTPEKLEP